MNQEPVIVIGAGIAGLTAAALLAHEGFKVILLESHVQAGGCAGTFRRGRYVFDVGATQVAGLESGGMHERLYRYLKISPPEAELLNPACLIDLSDGFEPIKLWSEPELWEAERKKQFPGSEKFWTICSFLHKTNWQFNSKNPVLPFRSQSDYMKLINALSPINLFTGLLSPLSVTDLLRLTSLKEDKRLNRFLDLQLSLYSQHPANRTAALYGASVLQIFQTPLGLWHLKGSMQKLSEVLLKSLVANSGHILYRHNVTQIIKSTKEKGWFVEAISSKSSPIRFFSRNVICTLPPQCLLGLMKKELGLNINYKNKLKTLPCPTGAIVLYGAIDRAYLQPYLSSHIQFFDEKYGSVFISISRDGDGRAPIGQATFTVSIFTKVSEWKDISQEMYLEKKEFVLTYLLDILNSKFNLEPGYWLHYELATPRSFEKWTGRPGGIVGGLGQTPYNFGPFGLPSRTPMQGIWLCGDSIYPGEGTAAVTQSAVMVVSQLMAEMNLEFDLPA